MKKIIITAAISLTIALNTAMAQPGLEVGFNIQPQSTWIVNQQQFDAGDLLDYKSTIRAAYGLHLGYNFTDRFGLRTGFTVSGQGQRYTVSADNPVDPNFEYSTKLNYMKIPVLIKYNSSSEASSSFIMTVGPQFGLLSGAERTLPSDLAILASSSNPIAGSSQAHAPLSARTGEVKDLYKNMDLSAVLGLGVRVNLTAALKLDFMLRFDYSLSDIENEDFKTTQFLYDAANDKRDPSQNATVGFNVGLSYIIGAN